MKAEIVATGTELVLGQTLNTSAHYLTGQLSLLGIEVDYHTTVGDNAKRLESMLRQAIGRSDLVITTGGLGPTEDDLTKELVAKVLDLPMVLDQDSLRALEVFFAVRKSPMPPNNLKQAYFPHGAKILPNPLGTAPGAIIEKDGRTVVILPGPPFEMQPMFNNHVRPVLEQKTGPDGGRLNVRVVKVFGIGESAIEEVLGELMHRADPSMALLAKRAEMHIRLVSRDKDAQRARQVLDAAETDIRRLLGDKVFGRDEDTLSGIVSQRLRQQGLTVATAESCTGGMLGAALTQVAGSSAFYKGGVIAYANEVKEKSLGVKTATLAAVGAVSPDVAREMAEGVRIRTGVDIALATTGIAGPEGGTAEKPVGLVYIGLAGANGSEAQRFQFYGGRESVRQLTVNAALDWLRRYLLG